MFRRKIFRSIKTVTRNSKIDRKKRGTGEWITLVFRRQRSNRINLYDHEVTTIAKVHCSSMGGRDNGFGSNYVWAGSLESGIQIATHHKKPVMLIIHKSWCSACKRLKPKFASSPEIQSLSKHFVMVNLVDDEEPKSNGFSPDGSYIPRILFISPNGDVDHEIYNEEGSSQHKYFYSRPEQIVRSMKKVLHKYKHETFDV